MASAGEGATRSLANHRKSRQYEAGAHVHEGDEKAGSKDSKCFDDPKFGEICK